MDQPLHPRRVRIQLESGQWRDISNRVFVGQLELPAMDETETTAWSNALSDVGYLDFGDITGLKAKEAAHAFRPAIKNWLADQGLLPRRQLGAPNPLACAGASFHHDARSYPEYMFCVLWLCDDTPWDLLFPFLGKRIPLTRGTIVFFDPAQVHGVVGQGGSCFDSSEIGDSTGIFLSQDLRLTQELARCMGIQLSAEAPQEGLYGLLPKTYDERVDPATGAWTQREPVALAA